MGREFKDKKSEYILKLALEESLKYDPDMVKYKSGKGVEHPHVFSKEHHERMKTIFKMAERAERRAKRRQTYRRVAAGVAVFLCLSSVMVSQVEAFRLPVIRFFVEMKEKSTIFGSHAESHLGLSEENRQYEPAYVPEGYVAVAVEEDSGGFYVKYENSQNKNWYTYNYWKKFEGIDVDTENGTVQNETINGNPAVVIWKEDEVRVILSIGTQRFYVNGTIPYEEAVKILESLN